jgi:hypothetical protein
MPNPRLRATSLLLSLCLVGCGGLEETSLAQTGPAPAGGAGGSGVSQGAAGAGGAPQGGSPGQAGLAGSTGKSGPAGQGGEATGSPLCGPCPEPPPCFVAACLAGVCSVAPSAAGSPCSDADGCTYADACDGLGACVPGGPPEMSSLFSGDSNAVLSSLIALDDGGMVAVGNTSYAEGSGYDVLFVHADRDGRQVVQQAIALDGSESVVALARAAGGYVAAGSLGGTGTQLADALLLGLSPSGEVLFQKTYDGGGLDTASAIVAMPDGGFALAGAAKMTGKTSSAWVLRVDAGGELVWSTQLAGEKSEAIRGVVPLGGGVLVAGYRRDLGAEKYDAWLAWLGASGELLERRTYVEKELLSVSALLSLGDAGALLVLDRGSSLQRLLLVRVDAAGDELWRGDFALPGGIDAPSRAVVEPDGAFTIASTLTSGKGRSIWFSRVSEAGELLAQVEVSPPGTLNLRASALARSPAGGYAMSGTSLIPQLGPAPASRAALFRFDPFGAPTCAPRMGCLGEDFAGCDDGDPCTIASCDGALGCQNTSMKATPQCAPK